MSNFEIFPAEKISELFPNYENADIRANIGDTSYSVEFFITENGVKRQSFDIAESGEISEAQLRVLNKTIAEFARTLADFEHGKINKYRFTVKNPNGKKA